MEEGCYPQQRIYHQDITSETSNNYHIGSMFWNLGYKEDDPEGIVSSDSNAKWEKPQL